MLCANKETPQCDVSQSNIAKEALPKKVRRQKPTASAAKIHRLRRQKPPLPATKTLKSNAQNKKNNSFETKIRTKFWWNKKK